MHQAEKPLFRICSIIPFRSHESEIMPKIYRFHSIAAFFLLSVSVLSGEDIRTWTDSTGKYQTEAKFVDLKDGKVRIWRKRGGTIVTVPLDRLSKADRDYAERVASQAPSVDASPKTPVVRPDVPDDDPVEQYIQSAINSGDRWAQVHARILQPNDARLSFKPIGKEGAITSDSMLAAIRLSRDFANLLDAARTAGFENALAPRKPFTDETNRIEARILLDKDVVGDLACALGSARLRNGPQRAVVLFLSPCTLSVVDLKKRFGEPTETIKAGVYQCYYYGRIVFVQREGQKLTIFRFGNDPTRLVEAE